MKTGTILDSDMATLVARLTEATRWWFDELAAMVPHRLKPVHNPVLGAVAHYRAEGDFWVEADDQPLDVVPDGAPLRRATIIIPASLCLIRTVALPAMRLADVQKLVALDLDRLMPFEAGTAAAAVSPSGDTAVDGKVDVAIAALPKLLLRSIYTAALQHGLDPRGLGIAGASGTGLQFDFMEALRADGVVARSRSGAGFWWGLVALFFALNLGILIFRDVQSVSRVAALVEAQNPSAVAARRLALRIAREDALRADLIARRSRDNALGALAFATQAVPGGAWVQRYSWNGELLRLSGYKQSSVDVLNALRKTGAFASVRASTSDVAAESTTGQPFDVTAELSREVKR